MRTLLVAAGVSLAAAGVVMAAGGVAPSLQTATAARSSAATTQAPAAKPATGPYDEQADAHHDITAALALAKQDHRNVLIDFGANWCPDCLVLSKLFEDPTVNPYLEAHFHVVKVDVGRFAKNLDISEQYGKPIDKGIPAVVVLDPAGSIVDSTKDGQLENARHSTTAEIVAYLKKWTN